MIVADLDLTAYLDQGFAVVPGLFSAAETAGMRAELDRMWRTADPADPGVHWRDHATLGRVADRFDPVQSRSAVFRMAALTRKLRGLAEAIVGGEAFILKDKVIMKRPGTAGYGAHQDFAYWEGLGLTSDEVVTAMIALDDITPAHGPIAIYPGLHDRRLAPDPSDLHDVDPAALAGHTPYLAAVKDGDVVFFHGLAPHASGPNYAGGSRRIYLITYARDSGRAQSALDAYADTAPARLTVHRRAR